MSRRPRSEMQFGSDSFLDVVANIVGILIILIVIAGLRVSQNPVNIVRNVTTTAPPFVPLPSLTEPDDPELEPLFVPEGECPNPAPLFMVHVAAPPELLPVEPPAGLMQRVAELEAELQQQELARRALAAQTAELHQTEAEYNERLQDLKRETAEKSQAWQQRQHEAQVQRTSLDQLLATAAELQEQLAVELRRQPPVETLEHRVTPLSKTVSGHEQHYRLSGNRVSEVPVTLLSVRLREQIERRKDWLMKQRSHQGVVGPVQGYSMNYLVQKDHLGVLDEVRFGQGMMRISVARWQIEPEPDVPTESATEALARGSRFTDSLSNADAGTSLTFWVYPDSYGLYRQLQRFAHEQGFLVAGPPLPHGIPISGSPNGSKSAGQ